MSIILSGAKHLASPSEGSFVSLRMTLNSKQANRDANKKTELTS